MNFKEYIAGNRHGQDANRFEQEAQNDIFLREAIDGFDENPDVAHLAVIEKLEREIEKEAKMKEKKKAEAKRYWYFGIAASFALLLGVLLLLRQQNQDEKIILAEKTVLPANVEKDSVSQSVENKVIAQELKKREKPILQTEQKIATSDMAVAEENEIKDANILNALQGKTAGVQIENISENFGSSLKIKEQEQIIRGKVLDENGEPLVGANVTLASATNGTVTDMNGNFTLTANDTKNAEIQANYIGYNTKTVSADSNFTVIHLDENQMALNEVVVVGYGTQKKRELTGATSDINAKKTKNDNTIIYFDKEKFIAYFAENKRDIQCKEENPVLQAEFIIDENGKPTNIKITECNCKKLENEFRRLLKNAKQWTIANDIIELKIEL